MALAILRLISNDSSVSDAEIIALKFANPYLRSLFSTRRVKSTVYYLSFILHRNETQQHLIDCRLPPLKLDDNDPVEDY